MGEKMFKKIEVERVVIDTFIESFKDIYLSIGLEEKEFESYCKRITGEKDSLFTRSRKENVEYKFIKDNQGKIKDMYITESFLLDLLKDEYKGLRREYGNMIFSYKTPRKEFIERSDKIMEILYQITINEKGEYFANCFANSYDSLFMLNSDILRGLGDVKKGLNILKEQGLIIDNPDDDYIGQLPKGETFLKERLGYIKKLDIRPNSRNKYCNYSTSLQWTIKGAEEARNIILSNLPNDKLDKYLEKKAKAK